MVHVVHRSIQVYQDFHRQTLSHLQQLEQDCYKLMPQFELEQVFGMVERAHYMKAGAKYLHLSGFEKLAHHVKGRYLALAGRTLTFERDLLKQLIQMQEVFRLCLLSNVSTWQADLTNVASKLPNIFEALDQHLTLHPHFSQALPSRSELEVDIQRLLVAIVLIPELARLDMMLKNTPASKLSEILTSQLPRLETLSQQLQLEELQRSMQISLLEIQARPSHAKTIGLQALLKWSDLCYKTLTHQPPRLISELNAEPQSSLHDAYAIDLERSLTDISVALIARQEEELVSFLHHQTQEILGLAQTHNIGSLEQISQAVLNALRYHPASVNLIGRLSIQDWLRQQITGIYPSGSKDSAENIPATLICETLSELAHMPSEWVESGSESDPMLLNLLTQVDLPDGFQEFSLPTVEGGQPLAAIAVNEAQLKQLSNTLQACQQDIEQLPVLPIALKQSFQTLLQDYHRLVTLPLAHIFGRFQPMVDALGLQGYKEVALKMSGGDIAIDRYRGEIIYELLVPLISNAVVHGIEKANEREAIGKVRKGKLALSAYAQGNNIQIELQDDGKGLNFEVLREWVINQYDLTHQEGNFLTEKEILEYLFRRQETKEKPLARREMLGLGSVQTSLDKLNGSIEVSSLSHQGTTFRIAIPKIILQQPTLNWSPQDALNQAEERQVQPNTNWTSPYQKSLDYSLDALRHQGQPGPQLQLNTQGLFIWADDMSVFILECDRIEEYVMPHVTEAHLASSQLNWRDQVIPIFSLQDFLGQEHDETSSPQEDVILVLKGEQQYIALRAPMQHLVSAQTLEINPLSQALAAPRYIYGTTEWTEGETEGADPRLVVDVSALIAQQPLTALFPLPEKASVSSDPKLPPVSGDATERSQPQIMVVDDSRTAREIVSMTLRQGGYDVIHAKDGLDALEQLQGQLLQNTLVDLIISDVAMPRMNGLEFLRRCRQDESLQAMPIAMLSNCDSTTHSELAIKEGANAYLTKPYEESVFLAEIAKLLAVTAPIVPGS